MCEAKALNGSCGKSLNSCSVGKLEDIADTSEDYLWNCLGGNGGSNANCGQKKIYSIYGCGEKGWVVIKTLTNGAAECEKAGIKYYDSKVTYNWEDEVCSFIVPSVKNCAK